ncbi:anaphase-promoting complex subunit 4 isoform X2 [Salarias fasciatus]|nr:anaphase-promoting complex subunit 4 isoform X2 [Salarias fasciatus]XP_029939302.1 anaphase-promoting complex subunit 4 isoform X2 [Salarias fasciatus]
MNAFRQVGEKQLPNTVLCMAWSPKKDLIALANTAGELHLHRLGGLPRVWSLPTSEYPGEEITAIAWRPDGKILAFSVEDTKQVVLCGVEKAEILHVFPVQFSVTCMHWMEVTEESNDLSSFYNTEDESKVFLPKLPTLPKSYSTASKIFSEEKSDKMLNLLGEIRLNILVLGGKDGILELYAYGMCKIATVNVVPGFCRSLSLSSDLKSLSIIAVVCTVKGKEVCYIQLDTGLLSDYLPEVTRMARKFTHISTSLQYLNLSLTCMCEAWEDILTQMDLRLTKFVQEKNTSTQVQDEFLELLLFGKSSPELQTLLMNQLTVKGLKKLGLSIESSYCSIQKLVISHLLSGAEALLYHLSEVKGMSLWKQKFEALGLKSAAIEEAITAVGSFSLKANELLQVIDKSMRNFKAFFRWLYVAMLRISEEHVPPELNKMTQKDISFVADFLSEHFSENKELFLRKGKYFNIERVGQYLKDKDENLVSPPDATGNQWLEFLKNTCKDGSPLLFPSYPQKSVQFVKRLMEMVIEDCLENPANVIGKSVKVAAFVPLYAIPESSEKTQHFELPSLWNDKKAQMHYAVFCMPEICPCKLFIMRRGTDPSREISNSVMSVNLSHQYGFGDGEVAEAQPLDARFYDDETLTVVFEGLREQKSHRVLAQLPFASILSSSETKFNWDSNLRLDQQSEAIPSQSLVLGNQWRDLENIKAQYVAVNGNRKVACVVSANLRHIRVFEMDIEEDDEGGDVHNASADMDVLEGSSAIQRAVEEGKGEAVEESGHSALNPETQLESEEALELS